MEFTVELGADGQLKPTNADAKAHLSKQAGTYYGLETSGDWLVFRPAKYGAPPSNSKPHIMLAADSRELPMLDFLSFLGQSQFTGVLRATSMTGDRSLCFHEGNIAWASSDAPSERLGQVLIRMGFVSLDQLNALLQKGPPSKLGRMMVDQGLIKNHDLFRALTVQVTDVVTGMLTSQGGHIMLVRQAADDRGGLALNLSLQNLLMDALRQIDEMSHYRKRIPHGKVFPVRTKPLTNEKIEADERLLFDACDGRKTLLDLCQELKMSEPDITRCAYRLMEAGLLRTMELALPELTLEELPEIPATAASKTGPIANPTPAGQPEGGNVVTPQVRRLVLVSNIACREITAEMLRIGRRANFLKDVQDTLKAKAKAGQPIFEGVQLQDDGSLPPMLVLKNAARMSGPAAIRTAIEDFVQFMTFHACELSNPADRQRLSLRIRDIMLAVDSG